MVLFSPWRSNLLSSRPIDYPIADNYLYWIQENQLDEIGNVC